MRSILDLWPWATRSQEVERVVDLAPRLRVVMYDPPKVEDEVQNGFESLLVGAGIPYKRETDSIPYSTKHYIPDFTIPNLNMAIEIKLCKRAGQQKELVDEINADILGYQKKFPKLLFIVYDLGLIRDVERFTSEFEHQGVMVRVVKH